MRRDFDHRRNRFSEKRRHARGDEERTHERSEGHSRIAQSTRAAIRKTRRIIAGSCWVAKEPEFNRKLTRSAECGVVEFRGVTSDVAARRSAT